MIPTARCVNNKGFTLVELLVVVAVIGILLGTAIFFYPSITERVKERTDQSNLRLLHAVTVAYRAGRPASDPFAMELGDDTLRWEALVPDYLQEQVVPKVAGMAFLFSEADGRWVYRPAGAGVTPSEHFSVGSPSTFRITGYDGKAGTDVVIPSEIDEVNITEIGHGSFSNKELTSVVFPSTITSIAGLAFRNNSLTNIVFPDELATIGNLAFADNQLTEIVLPDSVTSVGDGAFDGNHIVRIIIGANVAIGNIYSFGEHRPGGNRNFDKVYKDHNYAGGTYVWNGADWIKQ